MNKQTGFTLYEMIIALIMLAGVGGWIANVVKIATNLSGLDEITGLMILRVVGIFLAPLGAVLGYF